MTPDGQFRVDEEIVNGCGKIMLLDRMLPALIKEGHKVWCGVCGLECGKGVACAVLGKGVVLSKQIGIKQEIVNVMRTEGLECDNIYC